MFLAVDIGNSNIVLGLFEHDQLIQQVRVQTYDQTRWMAALQNFKDVEAVMLVSVVPEVTLTMKKYISALSGKQIKVYEVDANAPNTGIRFSPEVTSIELGADLFVNAIAVHHRFKRKCLSVDLGTASTFCVIEADGLYRGTTIVPGMRLALDALIKRAPLLPEIPFQPTEHIINTSTVSCLQSGIFFGYCALVDGLIERISQEHKNLYVVLTGGIGASLSPYLKKIDEFIPDLTLQGAQLLYNISVGKVD